MLAHLTQLRHLVLFRAHLTDEYVHTLAALTALQTLCLAVKCGLLMGHPCCCRDCQACSICGGGRHSSDWHAHITAPSAPRVSTRTAAADRSGGPLVPPR